MQLASRGREAIRCLRATGGHHTSASKRHACQSQGSLGTRSLTLSATNKPTFRCLGYTVQERKMGKGAAPSIAAAATSCVRSRPRRQVLQPQAAARHHPRRVPQRAEGGAGQPRQRVHQRRPVGGQRRGGGARGTGVAVAAAGVSCVVGGPQEGRLQDLRPRRAVRGGLGGRYEGVGRQRQLFHPMRTAECSGSALRRLHYHRLAWRSHPGGQIMSGMRAIQVRSLTGLHTGKKRYECSTTTALVRGFLPFLTAPVGLLGINGWPQRPSSCDEGGIRVQAAARRRGKQMGHAC